MSDLANDGLAIRPRRRRFVELSDSDARQLQRLLRLLSEAQEEGSWTGVYEHGQERATNPLVASHGHSVARAILLSRQARKAVFASSIFGEPAWDMLLTLYVAEQEGLRLTVTRLAEQSDAPLTTAIRWIDYLDQSKLVTRRPHVHDGRVVLVELTDAARAKLESYFRTIFDAGYVG